MHFPYGSTGTGAEISFTGIVHFTGHRRFISHRTVRIGRTVAAGQVKNRGGGNQGDDAVSGFKAYIPFFQILHNPVGRGQAESAAAA